MYKCLCAPELWQCRSPGGAACSFMKLVAIRTKMKLLCLTIPLRSRRARASKQPWCWPWLPTDFNLCCFPCLVKGRSRPLTTYLISVWQRHSSTCSAGIGNFYPHSLPSSCPESIWFPSGRLPSPMSIASQDTLRPRQRKSAGNPLC